VPLEIGGVADHVHILAKLPAVLSVSDAASHQGEFLEMGRGATRSCSRLRMAGRL
jgi:hypothetical protein